MYRTSFAIVLLAALAGAHAATANETFNQLAGQWRGNGTLNFADGTREQLRCRAAYDVLKGGSNLQLSIRCASDSFKFDLIGSAQENDGRITGTWSEANRNVAGRLSGTARGNSVRVVASSPTFSAALGVTTQGSKQTVSIRSEDPQSKVRGASLTLSR